MNRLLIATQNQGKFREIQALLEGLDIELIAPARIGLKLDVVEDGHTYLENAAKKAKAYAHASGLPTLADDSGLEVETLNGQPGLHSARFAPQPHATDADRRSYLLHELATHPPPWVARFRCVVVFLDPEGNRHSTEGCCPGEIIPEERGHNGFGYDPIFLVEPLGLTMAELTMEEKNRLSHRARAIKTLRPILQGTYAERT